MKIGLVSDHTYLPDRVGGRESSIHSLASQLLDLGHHVFVIANRGRLRDLPRRLPERVRWQVSYRIVRVRSEARTAEAMLTEGIIEAAIYNVRTPVAFASSDPRVRRRQIFYVRDAEDERLQELRPLNGIRLVANSQFTASWVRRQTGHESFVMLPWIVRSTVVAGQTGKCVTFINPVEEKGVSTSLAVASKMRDRQFLFAEGWELGKANKQELAACIERLGNVELMKATTQPREIYRKTRVLLVPSRWQEAFGRVAMEAQMNGIPVVASKIGGLPESVGPGGILIEPEAPISDWVKALRSLLDDERAWSDYSQRALGHAESYERGNVSRIQDLVDWLRA